ncbi:MAG: rhomboid family intramembrane serine protease [Bacteroidia bacterium]|nr:rhomboid family intramembrane serine protease [Bacteroidia bacterium]NNC86087.1 rhomboid family intramembrane serine protease [Bacteroidia bacterium]NNM15803.1 rhomboid family intramembrane serine protease [Bacteroidia bacterium]
MSLSVTLIIIGINVVLSLICFSNQELLNKLIFNPYVISARRQYYRFISSGFIHGDMMHLFVNMFVLYNFGEYVEDAYSQVFGSNATFYFLLLYFGSLVISIAPSYRKHVDNPNYNALGASGAVAAVLFAFIMFNPFASLYLMFIPIPIPAILVGVGYIAYEWYMGKKGGTNINHDAHLWGAIFGFFFTGLLKPDLFLLFLEQLIPG